MFSVFDTNVDTKSICTPEFNEMIEDLNSLQRDSVGFSWGSFICAVSQS